MNKKYFVALIVVALFATASVSANTAFKRLTATERPDYKLVVNNDAVELQNNPITINGVTYLPLREVATILDQDVNFDKGTITLKSKTTTVNNKEITIESERGNVTVPVINEPIEITVSIGTEFELGDVKLKVNSVTYSNLAPYENGGAAGIVSSDGEKLVLINFDVLIPTEPTSRFTWSATEFIKSVTVNGKVLHGAGSTGESIKINPNEKKTVEAYVSIPNDLEVSNVIFRNPTNNLETGKLIIN